MNKITIQLTEATLLTLISIVEYAKYNLEEAERKDPFKLNNYLINACDEFLQQAESEVK